MNLKFPLLSSTGVLVIICTILIGSSTKIKTPKNYVQLYDSVYISIYEETNSHYRQFLNDIKGKVPDSTYFSRLPDTSMWVDAFDVDFHDHWKNDYFNKARYDAYPVVNIDMDDINHYLAWKTEKWNNHQSTQVQFRLPTENEWRRAVRVFPGKPWPWLNDSHFKVEKNKIIPMANLYHYSYSAGNTIYSDDDAMYPIRVKFYEPNSLGLYHIIGNVAELTSDSTIKGGSWNNTLEESGVHLTQEFELPHPCVGFRPVVEVIQ
jgi:formylglycine-generating enzyme required for sulfatase activity